MNAPDARLNGTQRLMQQLVAAADPEQLLSAVVASPQSDAALELGLSGDDITALRALNPRHLLVYRKLIRGTFRATFKAQLPRTAARLGDEALSALVADFCEQQLPHSQVLRDVAYEICVWALPHWSRREDDTTHYAQLADLARFELFEFDVYAAENSPRDWPSATESALAAELAVVFDGSMRLTQLRWATHELPDDATDRSVPEQRDVSLLAYRDNDGDYRELELTPLAASIVVQLWRGQPLGAAITQACQHHGEPLDQAVIDGVSEVLADLAERGVLLGACAPAAADAVWPSPWARWLCYSLLRPLGAQELDGMPATRNNQTS